MASFSERVPGSAASAAARARRCDALFASPWGRYAWKIEAGVVLAELAPADGRRATDIGCGIGRFLPALASHGADALGVDIDPAMLALAAGRRPVIRRSSARGTSWARPARLARRCPARLAL